MFNMYVISKHTMNPFPKPCFWLVLNHYGTPIKGVYIQTILDWFGYVLGLGGILSLYDIFLKAIRYEAIALISSLI